METGEGGDFGEGKTGGQAFWGRVRYCAMEEALSSQSPHQPRKEGEGKREEFARGFLGKPAVESVAAFPPLLCFLRLFLFSPVGYYFLMCFDNYFINQER